MKKTLLTLAAIFCYSLAIFAQVPPHRTCGTMEYHEFLKQTRKNYEADFVQYNQMIDQYMTSSQFAAKTNGTNATITIPVVIHVVYNTAAQNISDAQAKSQFSVLDNDFNHLNADTVNIPLPFRSVAGKTGIRFCLAQRDPLGNATTGIIHKSTSTTSFTTDNKVKATSTGGDDAWDVTKYLNIWVCNLGTTLLGYGEFPTGTLSNTYGLVINYTATGTMGTATAPFNKGRTGTHEFGHCFNLNHIWGDNGQCGNTDNCTDTPPQKGGTTAPAGCNYGTPTYPWQPNTCTRPDGVGGASVTNTNGDMFMNFMDYTDDGAMNMFSKQQCLRMVAVVSTAPWNVLQSSNACTPVTALDAGITSVIAPINGSSSCNNSVTPKITLNNSGSTTITSASILYKMDAAATQTLNFTGSLASGASTVLTLNSYAGLSNTAHVFSVSVTSPNGGVDANAANNSMSSSFTIVAAPVGSALPLVEGFENAAFPPTGWLLQKANTINAATTWSRLANTTGLTAGSTAIAMMDNYSSASNISGQLDALRTPALSFTGANSSLSVSFDVSHKMYSTIDIDTLNVFISTDCGGTWTNLYNKGGSQLSTSIGTQTTAFTPTANTQWRRENISLTAYAGLASVYIKFESRSGWGNNVYLDNVNISYTTAAVPVASFTSSATKCSGSAITFSDQSTNTPASWNWSFPGGTPSSATVQNPSITYTANGSYVVTLVSTNGSGPSAPVSQTITVNATPTVAASNTILCTGSSVNLIATGATTYSWNTGATTSSISVTPTVTTNYTVTGATSGCINTKTVSVTVNTTPTVVVNSATVCSGTSANLSATGATSYIWNTGASTSSISVTPSVTTNYTVTGTNVGGCVDTKTASVIVNSTPTVVVNSATVCSGASANLSATGATSYIWNTGASTSSISVTPSVTTNYTVTGTNVGGCVDTKTASVTVNTTPTVVVNSATVCSGTSANLSAMGATSYIWNTGASTSSISVTPSVTANYTVTGASAGCTNTKTVSVTVNTTPTVVVNSAIVCSGASANLSATGATSYIWNTGASTSSISVTPSVTANYTVTGTNAGGCVDTKTASVTVNTTPIVVVNSATVCSGTPANLSATGATSYIWNTGASTSSISVTPSVTTNYTVTGTSSGCTNTKTVSVIVNSIPTVAVSNATICSGSTGTLVASGASTYTWNTGATGSNLSVSPVVNTTYTVVGTSVAGCVNTTTASVTVGSAPSIAVNSTSICSGATATLTASGVSTFTWSTGANTSSISDNPTSTTIYTVSGNLAGCTSMATNTATITVVSNPTVSVSNASICSGNMATLTASGATTYSWNTGATTSSISVTPSLTTNYTVTGSSAGCTNTRTVSITVNNPPTVAVSNATVCSGNAVTLTAGGATTYSWNTGANTASITATPSVSTNYTVTGTSAGCTNTKTVSVTVNTTPTANAGSSQTITCTAPTANLTGSGVSTYTWSGAGIVSGGNTATPVINAAGTYTLVGSTAGCSASPVTVNVTTNTSAPVVTSTASGSLDCVTSSVNVMASTTANQISWSGSGITAGAGTATITVNQGGVFNYTVTNTANGCTSAGSQAVTQNTVAPTVSVNSATICSGSTGTLTATGSAATYSWNTGTTGANLIASPAGNANYTVTATATNGCFNKATASITVGSAPSISVNSSIICSGSTATLTATGVTTYTWSTSSHASSISVNPTGTTVYTVTGNLTGCAVQATQTATVTVNLLPNVTLGTISGPLCVNNAPVTLSGSPAGGVYSGTGVSGSNFDPAVSGAGTFTVTYNYTDVNTCSASASQTVNVNLCTGLVTLNGADAFSISVYPNPTKDNINVMMDASFINSNTTIELYDAIGKLIITEKVVSTNTSVIINSLSTGMYTLRVVSDGKQISKRIIKQ